MTQHDEVSGLRDIIRHDVMMDAKAMEKLHAAKIALKPEQEHIRILIEDAEVCILSTLSDASKMPGTLTIGIVE